MNRQISIKFCICIDIYIWSCCTLRTLSVHPSVIRPSVCQRFVSVLTLEILTYLLQTLHRQWYRGGVVWDCKWANFILKEKSYGPWCMSKMFCTSFPCSNFSTFLSIFFKLCIDIGIGEELYGIVSWIISLKKQQLWLLIYVQNAFLVNILRMNRGISMKFCTCIA